MLQIMISYRRLDSQDIAMRIRDMLIAHYEVFIDIYSTPLGTDFREQLNLALSTCDALIAIVGPRWHDNIHNETDFVRIELETALKRQIPIVPALVLRAKMPAPSELPDVLRDFAFRQGTAIDSGVNFRHDVDRLIKSFDKVFSARTRWEAKLSVHYGSYFSIQICRPGEQHLLEYSRGYLAGHLKLNHVLIETYYEDGQKVKEFKIGNHPSVFTLKFYIGTFTLHSIEIWIN
jgi:TIR domain